MRLSVPRTFSLMQKKRTTQTLCGPFFTVWLILFFVMPLYLKYFQWKIIR